MATVSKIAATGLGFRPIGFSFRPRVKFASMGFKLRPEGFKFAASSKITAHGICLFAATGGRK